MKFAGIIAAGRGSRLAVGRPGILKPLVPVGGKPLIYWVVSGLRAAGFDSVVVLINGSGGPVRDYLKQTFSDIEWTFLQKDTATSWESFRLVSKELASRSGRFVLSTVDAIVPPVEVKRFAEEAFRDPASVAALALTGFVEDEKPLWADMESNGRISALGDDAVEKKAVTTGLYALTSSVADSMPSAKEFGRLREFWMNLVNSGDLVRGVKLADTVDVDRPEDLAAAEKVTLCFDA